jgi:hypothetical protein
MFKTTAIRRFSTSKVLEKKMLDGVFGSTLDPITQRTKVYLLCQTDGVHVMCIKFIHAISSDGHMR